MLDQIVARTKEDLPSLRLRRDEFEAAVAAASPPRGFAAALRAPGLSVIAEVKRKSPSRGLIDGGLDPRRQAARYAAGGAAAVSVLTEPHFFAGSPMDLVDVRSVIPLPVLRKDFVVDPIQVVQARALGADAILLIMACLSDEQARELHELARSYSLDVLVEAHTSEEAERAVQCGAEIIGVNNRDLATFDVSIATAERIAPTLPSTLLQVGESGIWTAEDAQRMRSAGFDAILVGEALVRAEDPEQLIGEFRGMS